MSKWQLQEAKSRFSELIDETLEKGPSDRESFTCRNRTQLIPQQCQRHGVFEGQLETCFGVDVLGWHRR